MVDSDRPVQGHSVFINGIEMYYETHGQGEPLVMLHGFTFSGQTWNSFIPDFEDHFQLIIPDLRGHGRSTNPSKKFTHRQAALDIFALLDHLGIEQFKAIGHSSGGMALIHMAAQQPNRVEAMIIISATPYFPQTFRESLAEFTVEKYVESVMGEKVWRDYYREIHFHGDEQIRLLIEQFHNLKDSYDDMDFTSSFLSTITAKTLIIHGDRDEFFPASIPTDMYNSIPNAYLWIIPNGNHLLFVFPAFGGSAPGGEVFTKVAYEFLREDWNNK